MAESIRHRGPDSIGRVNCETLDVEFRRLAIIDLAGGSQPVWNEQRTVACVLNGEIFNYQELRCGLIRRGHCLRTNADSEVLPHLYEEYGAEMFGKLNGMFAICLFDMERDEILLARDHFGVKQLYYSDTPHGTVFASEMKAILASGLVNDELDSHAVLAYLTLFYSPGSATIVSNVRKVPPGSIVRIGANGCESPQCYYALPEVPPKSVGNASHETELCELLREAVSRQLQADVPVAISLSGGVDSCAIACAAAASGQENLLAVTVACPNAPEEESTASALCNALGLRHHVLAPAAGTFHDYLGEVARIADEPIADPALFTQWFIARAASQHVKVLLSGAGGDELFGGYGSYFPSQVRRMYAQAPGLFRDMARPLCRMIGVEEKVLASLNCYRTDQLPYHALCMSNDTGIEHDGWGGQDEKWCPFAHMRKYSNRYEAYDSLNKRMLIDLHTYLPDQVLPMLDRATMAASVEGRVPFLDVPLVEWAFSLSGRDKCGRKATPKALLKKAIHRMVPGVAIAGPKRGLPSPVRAFIEGTSSGIVSDILLQQYGCVSGIVGKSAVKRWIDEPRAYWRVTYSALLLELWHDQMRGVASSHAA